MKLPISVRACPLGRATAVLGSQISLRFNGAMGGYALSAEGKKIKLYLLNTTDKNLNYVSLGYQLFEARSECMS